MAVGSGWTQVRTPTESILKVLARAVVDLQFATRTRRECAFTPSKRRVRLVSSVGDAGCRVSSTSLCVGTTVDPTQNAAAAFWLCVFPDVFQHPPSPPDETKNFDCRDYRVVAR